MPVFAHRTRYPLASSWDDLPLERREAGWPAHCTVHGSFANHGFTKLQKAGLVAASEGARGGFRLARDPRSISALDVVVAIDGKKRLFECREIHGRCAIFRRKPPTWATRGVCAIHAVMLEADTRMRETLASCTLSDLAARFTAKAPRDFTQEIATWLEMRSPAPRRARTHNSSL